MNGIFRLSFLALLCVIFAGITRASTTFDISTGTVTYTITSDTNGGTLDNNYTGPAIDVTSLPTGQYAHIANGLSNGISSTALWVGPNADQVDETSSVTGTTTYTVTFNLTGYNPTGTMLVMSLGADDFVSTVVLNSTTIFTVTSTEKASGMYATAVTVPTVTSGFVAGVNTITFTVPNSTSDGANSCCGPTGLIASVDVIAATPEPATFGALGLGLLALGAFSRSRKR